MPTARPLAPVLPWEPGAGRAEVWPGSFVCPGLVVDLPGELVDEGAVAGLLACPGEDCDLPGFAAPACGDFLPDLTAGVCARAEDGAVPVLLGIEPPAGRRL
jgi:hypothetical protein